MTPNPLGRWRDAIFFASGFAGLIYESIWTHYLKLFLGHAAHAQTLVLAIFMGGMAVGAALTARSTANIAQPLRAYALVEAAVGVLALAFHPVFVGATDGFYDFAFGRHLDGASFAAMKWGLAVLLILPQSILLGATFPLFASAATRAAPAGQGRPIATLYFANSIGGAAGVLASGFVLVPALGLFGTIAAAGALNLALAATVLALTARAARCVAPAAVPERKRAAREAPAAIAIADAASTRGNAATARVLLAVSFLTGASSFIYEIGWIRMLSLVLGSATHSFELMLSSFVLGLALGGLWIRKRIDAAANPGVLLGWIQVAMGGAALATVPLHSASFDLVAWAVGVLPKSDGGYALFNLLRYGIASLIMFPAAFCAGMTLPLATRLLYSTAGQGERAIGLVYSANTLGAITGLAFAVHVGMPVLGLEYLVASGALVDVLLGAGLLVFFGARASLGWASAALVACAAATAAVAHTFDPQKLASGVFRTGRAHTSGAVLEVAHGKTATITVEKGGDFVTIKTNGKADAAANLDAGGEYALDQVTMTLLAAIPLLMHDAPRRVANIGFGSGITGDAMLSDPRVLQLDTIEIEPRMVDLARQFGPLNRSVYTDPRSAIRIDDARSFFAAGGNRYDVIVSEPSNPWVSGVSGLFSVEFYRHVARYLNEDGLFAQWLQTYETNPDRFASVLKAVDRAFDDYLVVVLDDGDALLVARGRGKVALPRDAIAKASPAMRRLLRRVDVANQSDITFRVAGDKALFRPWLDAKAVPANSDFVPYLDSNADRDRYLDRDWNELVELALSALPIAEVLGGRPQLLTPSALTVTRQLGPEPPWLAARMAWEAIFGPPPAGESLPIPDNLSPAVAAQGAQLLAGCENPPPGDSAYAAARFGTRVLPFLSPAQGRDVLGAVRNAACFTSLYGTQQQWPVLLRYAAQRDAENFGRVADEMLVSGLGATEVRTRYLLGMAMLGRIRAGDRARAQALWTQFSPRALGGRPPDLGFELLRAHAFAGAGPQ